MTDRELLEAAAKATGHRVIRTEAEMHGCEETGTIYRGVMLEGVQEPWRPLSDDGDALRLAVRLNLHIGIDAESAGCITIEWDFDESGTARLTTVQPAPEGGDDSAATRRAIVRAAAAVGECMAQQLPSADEIADNWL